MLKKYMKPLVIIVVFFLIASLLYVGFAPIVSEKMFENSVEKFEKKASDQSLNVINSNVSEIDNNENVKSSDQQYVKTIMTVQDINHIVQMNEPLIIKCYMSGCSACDAMESIYALVAKKMYGKVKFYELNVDNEICVKELHSNGIIKEEMQYMPTFIYYVKNSLQEQSVGMQSEQELMQKIKTLFNV